MRNLILTLFFATSFCSAQKAIYNKTKEEGKFTEYQTKSGNLIKIGDTINIGYPMGQEFTFLTQGNIHVASFLSNNKVVVSKIKSVGNPTRGYKIYTLFGGYGTSVYIDYEAALETGEIKNPFITQ
ncbi:hypothetical protein [Flavobacterium aestivum]|uniref:hypothetical protein n=1 Tax=Flavobacterium aestivum TaxID=3003257 RepID=UPI0022853BE8|nr:hypothetical protein [Flavobacterium aestivum]